MPPYRHCDVAKDQLNLVTETVGCKQLVPHLATQVAAAGETAFNPNSKPIYELIKALQAEDTFVWQQKLGEPGRTRKNAGAWTWDSQGALRYRDRLYVPEEASVREKLLRRHHDCHTTYLSQCGV